MIRVTLRADRFRDDWPIQQPGEIITLQFGGPVEIPASDWKPWRNYTVRSHRADLGEIDVDVVLHEPKGPACTGAAEMRLGGRVGYAGPRVDFVPRDDAEWLLLCGDETALPAIAAILEAPPVPRVFALVEVADSDEELPMNRHIRWARRRARRDHVTPRRRTARGRARRRSRPGLGRGGVAHRARPQDGPARRPRDAEVARDGAWLLAAGR